MSPKGTQANYMSRVHAGLAKLKGTPSSGGGATSSSGGTSGSYNPQNDPNNPEYRPPSYANRPTKPPVVYDSSGHVWAGQGAPPSSQRTTAPTTSTTQWQSEAQIREAIFRGEATSMDLAVFRNAQLGKSTTVHYQKPVASGGAYPNAGDITRAELAGASQSEIRSIETQILNKPLPSDTKGYTGAEMRIFNQRWGRYIDPETGYFTGTSEQLAQAQADYAKVSAIQADVAPYVSSSGNIDIVAAMRGGVSLQEIAAVTGKPVSDVRRDLQASLLSTPMGKAAVQGTLEQYHTWQGTMAIRGTPVNLSHEEALALLYNVPVSNISKETMDYLSNAYGRQATPAEYKAFRETNLGILPGGVIDTSFLGRLNPWNWPKILGQTFQAVGQGKAALIKEGTLSSSGDFLGTGKLVMGIQGGMFLKEYEQAQGGALSTAQQTGNILTHNVLMPIPAAKLLYPGVGRGEVSGGEWALSVVNPVLLAASAFIPIDRVFSGAVGAGVRGVKYLPYGEQFAAGTGRVFATDITGWAKPGLSDLWSGVPRSFGEVRTGSAPGAVRFGIGEIKSPKVSQTPVIGRDMPQFQLKTSLEFEPLEYRNTMGPKYQPLVAGEKIGTLEGSKFGGALYQRLEVLTPETFYAFGRELPNQPILGKTATISVKGKYLEMPLYEDVVKGGYAPLDMPLEGWLADVGLKKYPSISYKGVPSQILPPQWGMARTGGGQSIAGGGFRWIETSGGLRSAAEGVYIPKGSPLTPPKGGFFGSTSPLSPLFKSEVNIYEGTGPVVNFGKRGIGNLPKVGSKPVLTGGAATSETVEQQLIRLPEQAREKLLGRMPTTEPVLPPMPRRMPVVLPIPSEIPGVPPFEMPMVVPLTIGSPITSPQERTMPVTGVQIRTQGELSSLTRLDNQQKALTETQAVTLPLPYMGEEMPVRVGIDVTIPYQYPNRIIPPGGWWWWPPSGVGVGGGSWPFEGGVGGDSPLGIWQTTGLEVAMYDLFGKGVTHKRIGRFHKRYSSVRQKGYVRSNRNDGNITAVAGRAYKRAVAM